MSYTETIELFNESESVALESKIEEMITARNKEVIFHTEYDYLIMRYYDERLNKFIWEYKEEKREKLNRKHIKTYFLIGLPLFLICLILDQYDYYNFLFNACAVFLVFFGGNSFYSMCGCLGITRSYDNPIENSPLSIWESERDGLTFKKTVI